MNIYEFATDFEKEHRDFYLEQMENTADGALKKVFGDLAEEERKHLKIVKQLSEDKKVEQIESDILPRARKAFEDISANLPDSVLPTDQVEVYKKAREMEARSYEFYQSKAEESDLPFVKKAFKQLAEEEKKHENIMDNLVEFVNRPNTWLDDAEWYHLEEY